MESHQREKLHFYLGTHEPNWLSKAGIPLMVSHRRLAPRKTYPKAWGPWILDSGGFTELSMYGEWRVGVDEYIEATAVYQEKIGQLQWAAPQDWMCEPQILAKTGLTVKTHQELTVNNFLTLEGRGPFIPVIQGWEIDDYHYCIDLYNESGIDLAQYKVVGVGSVCRRQDTATVEQLFTELAKRDINTHGFGVKTVGLGQYGHLLTSADSMAWSFAARYDKAGAMVGCTHKACNNCMRYAIKWWTNQVLAQTAHR